MAGVINGTDLRLYAGVKPIGYATSCTLSLSRETREIVHKDNVAGYAASEGGKRSYSISFENFASEDDTLNSAAVNSINDLLDLFEGEAFAWKFTTDETGEMEISGNALFTDLSITAPVEESTTSSGTFTGTGAISRAVVA
jgi:predicted secreted protein